MVILLTQGGGEQTNPYDTLRESTEKRLKDERRRRGTLNNLQLLTEKRGCGSKGRMRGVKKKFLNDRGKGRGMTGSFT